MMECRVVLARAAPDASARIGAVRDAHLAVLRPMAAEGSLILGLPLMGAEGGYQGSLMVVASEAVEAYLDAEPFRRHGIWESHTVHPFRVAPLPYQRLPEGTASAQPTHTVVIARDGGDEGALARRMAVREKHFSRVRPFAADGTLVLGGALLDAPGGRMTGSIAVTAHPTVQEAQAWWKDDPYITGGVWQDIAWHATRFAPLPYRPLPGAD
jgi:uncharacterized protein YciI